MCVTCDNKVEKYLNELDKACDKYFDRDMRACLKDFHDFLEGLDSSLDSNFTMDFMSQGFKEALAKTLKVLNKMEAEDLIAVAIEAKACNGRCGKDYYLQLESGMFLSEIIELGNGKKNYLFSQTSFYRCHYEHAYEALNLFGGSVRKI